MTEQPLVSVCTITYNQAPYIHRTIEGVLNQRTSFPVELVISDDCSTDGTREICRRYAEEYPEKIRLIAPEKNQGVRGNFTGCLAACTGRYIALCEGDDYWTDPDKLQQQVDYLEAHPDCAICFHDVEIVGPDSAPSPQAERHRIRYKSEDETDFSCEDLLRDNNRMHTPTVVFRKNGDYGFLRGVTLDYFLHITNATHGYAHRIPKKMAAYRVHDHGVFSGNTTWSDKKRLQFYLSQLEGWQALEQNVPFTELQSDLIIGRQRSDHHHILTCALLCGDYATARRFAREELKKGRFRQEAKVRRLSLRLILLSPRLLRKIFRYTIEKKRTSTQGPK